MRNSILWRAAILVTAAIVSSGSARAGGSDGMRLEGVVSDYTATADPAGPWHITGVWSLALRESGKGRFSLAVSMVRSQSPSPSAHSHHVTIGNGDVTSLPNGFAISGDAVMSSNGNLAPFSGSPVEVQVTGGNALPFSNLTVTFGGAAAAHFGELPLHGIVTSRR